LFYFVVRVNNNKFVVWDYELILCSCLICAELLEVIKALVPFVSRVNLKLNNPWTPSIVTGTRNDDFRQLLKAQLGIEGNNISCMLTGQVGNGDQVCGAHILPCSTEKYLCDELNMTIDDLNSPRNGLFLARNVEREFDSLNLSFVVADVLHPNVFKMVIWADECRYKPIWNRHLHAIGQYESCTLILNDHKPFRRALSFQAYQAHTNARGSPARLPPEFGTPPSSFNTMRRQLEGYYETAFREEVAESEPEDS
jgi:hypothetical protein